MDDVQEDFICFAREPLSQEEFDKIYKKPEIKKTFREHLKERLKCSKDGVWKILSSSFPLLHALRYYDIRRDFIADILSGITCGLFQIPHALAFAMLAKVGIENGLYTTVWPVILYGIFGTTVHASVGTSAIVCMYMAGIIDRQTENFTRSTLLNSTNASDPEYIAELASFRNNIASSVALLTGVVLIFFGLLKASFLSHILSEAFMKAFTTGTAIHIIISQLPTILALKINIHGGIFKIGYTIAEIFEKLSSVHGMTLLIAAITMMILLIFQIAINRRIKSTLRIPFPVELFVVILGIIMTAVTNLKQEVTLIGPLPKILRPPYVPDLSGATSYIVDSFILAILIYESNTAVSQLFAKKHNYVTDDNQELYAYGFCNFVGAFLRCIPSSVSCSRSMVYSLLNARTTFCGIVSGFFMLLIVAISSYVFEYLPISILSAIIVVSMKSLLFQIIDVRKFWRVNKFEYLVWLFTLICTVFLDLNYGFLIGFGLSIILVVVETQFVHGFKLNKTVEDKIMVQHNKYKNAMETAGIKIFRFQSNVYFANAEIFKLKLYRKTVNPRKLLKYIKKQEKKEANLKKVTAKDGESKDVEAGVDNKGISLTGDIPAISIGYKHTVSKNLAGSLSRQQSMVSTVSSTMTNLTNYTNESEEEDPDDGQTYISMRKYEIQRKVHHVILDFSTVNYIDYTGANMLIQIICEYGNVDIKVYLANCLPDILKTMEHSNVFDAIPKTDIFLDVYDAVAAAIHDDRSKLFASIERELSQPSNG